MTPEREPDATEEHQWQEQLEYQAALDKETLEILQRYGVRGISKRLQRQRAKR